MECVAALFAVFLLWLMFGGSSEPQGRCYTPRPPTKLPGIKPPPPPAPPRPQFPPNLDMRSGTRPPQGPPNRLIKEGEKPYDEWVSVGWEAVLHDGTVGNVVARKRTVEGTVYFLRLPGGSHSFYRNQIKEFRRAQEV